MTTKKVMISVDSEDLEFLKKHPELSKTELFRLAVREYRREHFTREVNP
jgi:hypothetical protein